jgi:thiamine biosynthesis lipoprotein ApbE
MLSTGALVPTTPESPHLDSAHRDTLSRLFQHPASHNIEWHDIVSLLEAVGSVDESHDGKFTVTVGEETETFERPRDKDIDVQQVVDLRRMLTNAGYASGSAQTDSEGREP